MWNTILLNDTHTLALMKAASRAGHLKLMTPTTESEKRQLKAVESEIAASPLEQAALTYCLLADNVHMDGSGIGWRIFENTEDDADIEDEKTFRSSPLIQETSRDFDAFVGTTDSSRNFLTVHKALTQGNEAANAIATLEPLIWRSFHRRGANVSRAELRFVLDVILLEPRLLGLQMSGEQSDFEGVAMETISRLLPPKARERHLVERLSALCSIAITKGSVAANQMAEVERLDAAYPVDNLSLGGDRTSARKSHFRQFESEELVAATGLFLSEVRCWPVLTDFNEVLRLRMHQDFKTFRDNMRRWTSAILRGDLKEEATLRKDIEAANLALSRVTNCTKIGGLLTYIGLPLTIVDMLAGAVFGTPLTVAGFGLQAYSDWVKKKNRWIMIGRE